MTEHILIGLVSIIALGIIAQWLAWRLKLPAILLLLVFGIVAGPIAGLLEPDAIFGDLLGPFVSLSVAVILFEGGLSLRLSELKEIGGVVMKLISIGILVTWVLAAVFAYLLLNLSLQLSVLFGAILIVTGPTVIIPLLRQVRPAGAVGSVLKWEGIINDPIGAMMSVLVFEIILAGGMSYHGHNALLSILNTLAFGSFFGLLGAGFIYIMLKRHLIPDFLQNPVSLMVVVVVFALSNMMQEESGLLAVTLMGIALANQKTVRVKHIVEFKENLRVLLISALFIMLASRLKLYDLSHVNWSSLAFLGALIFIVRPTSIFISTIGSRLNMKERLFLSWMAPRGIVAAAISSIFALRLVDAGYTDANLLIPYTFIVIIGTVTIYGLSANWVAVKLNVAKPVPRGILILGAHDWARNIACRLHKEGFKILVADSNWANISKARQENLDTYYGNILSEYAIDDIDLDGIGHLMAMTPNDEVNSLAVIRFADLFGTSEVYQLAPINKSRRNEREVPEYLSGRILFDPELNYEKITSILEEGGTLETSSITEEYTMKDLKNELGESATPLFIIKPTHEVKIFSVDHPPVPAAGDKIVSLVPNQEAKEGSEVTDELKSGKDS